MLSSRRAFLRARTDSAPPPRPPWALAEADFVAHCTRCDACVNRCPDGLLKRGDGGFPWLDFRAGGCSFCGDCLDACVPGALRLDNLRAPLPFVASIGPTCLNLHGVECRSCVDPCETRAIRIRPRPGHQVEVTISAADCSGCGACLAPCPVNAVSLQRTGPSPTEAGWEHE